MERLRSLENKTRKAVDNHLFRTVSEVLGKHQVEGYVIGGYVRDLLLDRPCKDIDFVVVGSGIDMAHAVADALRAGEVHFFKNFGTAMFRYQDLEVEFVGARKESYVRDSRKPLVEEGTLKDDQERRDFTINALAIDMKQDEYRFGALVDPFNGLSDLENGIIRTPLDPDITFSDDPLRMMRAIRFASQLNFDIHHETFEAITRNAHRINIISQERITDEINKIMLSKRPSVGFRLLFQSGLLELIFPELHDLHGVETKDGVSHKDNFFHTIKVVDQLAEKSDDLWLRWAALLHDIAKPATKRFHEEHGWTFHGHEERGSRMVPKIFRRMKLPMDAKMKYVQKLVALHLRPIALTREEATDSAIRRLIFEAGDDLDDLMSLCESDITTRNKERMRRYLERFARVRERVAEVEERDHIRNWQPPISGDEIIRTFGIKPSKEVGMLKAMIKDAILDGDIPNNYEAAKELLIKKGKELGLKPVK